MAKKWLKLKVMDRKLSESELEKQKMLLRDKLCLHCVHRKSKIFHEHTKHRQVYCEMQPSVQSNSGYRTIKAHDFACGLYEQRL